MHRMISTEPVKVMNSIIFIPDLRAHFVVAYTQLQFLRSSRQPEPAEGS